MRLRALLFSLLFVFSSLHVVVPQLAHAAVVPLAAVQVTGSKTFSLAPGEIKNVTLTFQNSGTSTWKNDGAGYISLYTHGPKYRTSVFDPGTWLSAKQVKRLQEASVAPGKTGTFSFELNAPQTPGTYSETFALASENTAWILGGEITFSITVAERIVQTAAVETPFMASPATDPDSDEAPFIASLVEPMMRVGVLIVDEETNNEVIVGSQESDVELRDTDGTLLLTIPKGSDLRAAYENGTYVYGSGAAQKKSSLPLRFVPTVANAVLEITNFDRRVTRGTSYANNTFRNVLEIRYNSSKDRTWLINELSMEYYLRGLAETSNSSPAEFQKALLTAARTYGYYHYTHASKHAAEGFHVDAYRDQVYWGYGQEERNPLIAAAVEASRGYLVTYQGEPTITSYFSRSDGHTRSWSDVWGGNIPYAKSVVVPCDAGKTLWGHGVGMSASGAICMANDGKTWQEILTYFYTGVEVTREWE